MTLKPQPPRTRIAVASHTSAQFNGLKTSKYGACKLRFSQSIYLFLLLQRFRAETLS